VARRALTGVLLVGGASSRFGSPKALARIGDETLAERGWRLLGAACDERIAVGKHPDRLPLPFPVLDDGTAVRHPAAGILAGLRAARHEVCVFLPVDCPLVTPSALRKLGEACADAAIAQTGDPLPGAFATSAVPVLERFLVAEGSIRGALAELDVRTVQLDPAILVNANTRDELRGLG
jgi:molybdopterin-guanine dinucleotide biosynthesis protein A